MKTTLTYIAIITTTFVLAFAISGLLTVEWFQSHWARQFLVLLLMAIVLVLGGLMLWQKAKSLPTP